MEYGYKCSYQTDLMDVEEWLNKMGPLGWRMVKIEKFGSSNSGYSNYYVIVEKVFPEKYTL